MFVVDTHFIGMLKLLACIPSCANNHVSFLICLGYSVFVHNEYHKCRHILSGYLDLSTLQLRIFRLDFLTSMNDTVS